jgi:hypothetical protein
MLVCERHVCTRARRIRPPLKHCNRCTVNALMRVAPSCAVATADRKCQSTDLSVRFTTHTSAVLPSASRIPRALITSANCQLKRPVCAPLHPLLMFIHQDQRKDGGSTTSSVGDGARRRHPRAGAGAGGRLRGWRHLSGIRTGAGAHDAQLPR